MKQVKIAIFVIILFHAVGLAGLLLPAYRTMFLQLVPWHLLLMFIVVVLSYGAIGSRFYLFAAIIFIAGMLFEYVGVHTRLIFGDYAYGRTLGVKIGDIPLTMGINWFLLVWSAGVLTSSVNIRNIFLRVLLGATILTLLDLLIEPIAMRFDYWHWSNNTVPLKNYIAWLIVSGGMLFIFESFKFRAKASPVAALLIAQYVFFGVLNLALS